MKRIEQSVPAGIILLVGLWVAYISFTQNPAEAFVFPRLISSLFVVLSVWVFVKGLLGGDEAHATIPLDVWLKILPGLAVSFIYVFWAAQALGFYTATSVTVFVLISLYDPAPHGVAKSWWKRAVVTASFMVIMYLLFKTTLGVFTPGEVLFR